MDTPNANSSRVLKQLKEWNLTPEPIAKLFERTSTLTSGSTAQQESQGDGTSSESTDAAIASLSSNGTSTAATAAPAYFIELSAKTQANIPVLKQAILKVTYASFIHSLSLLYNTNSTCPF
jgi:hypothetical protein